MSSGLLQVFVELGNLRGTSNYVLYWIHIHSAEDNSPKTLNDKKNLYMLEYLHYRLQTSTLYFRLKEKDTDTHREPVITEEYYISKLQFQNRVYLNVGWCTDAKTGGTLLFRYERFINFWFRFFDTRRETILKSLS